MDFSYLFDRPDLVLDATIEHLYITIVAVLVTVVIGVALGILITRMRFLYEPILTATGVIYTIPSLAMFVMLIPILGIGFTSAVVALVLYSLLVIIRNTAVGIDGVDENITEAARGMGMTPLGILLRVEVPLAMPIIFAGIRIATVSAISIATIAAFIGAGGIGELLFQGMSSQQNDKIIAGAFMASLMAMGAEILLRQVERGASPGLSGGFKTLGEQLADFFGFLKNNPDIIIFTGALFILISYFALTWIEPYGNDPDVIDDAEVMSALEDADYSLEKTGYELARLNTDATVQRSLQLLPWFAGIALLLAAWNTVRSPGSRASAELMLICGLLAFFPLGHFYTETLRATGELGTVSDLVRAVRNDLNTIGGARVSPQLESLDLMGGYYVAIVGAILTVIGAYLKSMWFRRQTRELEEAAT
jgi:osmoprotectant transport system permease protein